jgi:DNA-binding NarL/FixJ family response regulator
MIRIVLAEDHTLVREAIRTLLSTVPEIEVAGEAGTGIDAVRVVESLRPDVLVLDMRMPQGDGSYVVNELSRRGALVPTLVLTTFDDEAAALDVIAAGARGFLLKDVTVTRLVDALRTLAAGGRMILPNVSERAVTRLVGRGAAPPPPSEAFTTRELDVLRLLAGGYSNREIARALFVAEGTVKNRVSKLLQKLGVRDRSRAALIAIERGYV